MAFSGFSNQEQLFQSQNQGGILPRQQTRSFQQNQPYGIQAFTPQHSQIFAGSFAPYQMEPQMGPQMGQPHGQQVQPSMVSQMSPHMNPQIRPPVGPQMGLQMGSFSSNVQMGHQFPKQQQRLLDQQRKIAEENQKKQDELMKKKQFEIQQRKLQSLNARQGVKSVNPLNELFGKKDKGMVPSVAGLIGSLGQDPSPKPAAASKPSSIFSRPGGNAAHHSHPNQWGPGFMTSPGQMVPHGSGVGAGSRGYNKPADDFGDFEQGPTFSGQNPNDGDFSDFQEAPPVATFEGGSFVHSVPSMPGHSHVSGNRAISPQVQGWSGPTAELSRNVPIVGVPSSSHHGTFSMAQGTLEMSSVSSIQGTSPSWSQEPRNVQGTGKTSLISENSRPRSDSLPGVMQHKYSGNGVGMFRPGAPVNQVNTNRYGDSFSFGGAPSSGGSIPPCTVAPSLGGFVTGPIFHGQAIVPPVNAPTTPLEGGANSVAETETEMKKELVTDPETEETPERKLELLYGITLPDWCVNGTDLPGIYRDVADKTVTLSDAVDTNQLFPILMACDLPRDKLGHIWNQANRAVPGQLNTLELRIVLGLVALGQAGIKTERLTVEKLASCKAAPIPTIPEDVLQSKGRGWSFTETTGGSTSAGGLNTSVDCRTSSSGETIDSSDKYSVFRTVDQSVVMAAVAVDANNKHGTPRMFDQHVVKLATLPAEMSSFQGAVSDQGDTWSRPRTEAYKVRGQSFDAQDQQQNFGDFQSETTQYLGSNLSVTTNQVSEFGDFQGESNWNSKAMSISIEQDNFGEFHDGSGRKSGNSETGSSSINEEPTANVADFQSNTDWNTSTDTSQEATVVKPLQDDFGDFHSGKESEIDLNFVEVSNPFPRQHHKNEQQQEKQPVLSDFGSFQMKGGFDSSCKTSDVASHNLLCTEQKSNYPTSESATSKNHSSDLGEVDDFSEFQQSPSPVCTQSGGSDSLPHFGKNSSAELASSLEKFKISSHFPYSVERGSLFASSVDSEKATKNLSFNNAEDNKNLESNILVANFPSVPKEPFKASSCEIDSQEDRYSALRDADLSSARGLFNTVIPGEGETNASADDDGFHDFGGFEAADEFETNADSKFGAYKSMENLTLTHQGNGSFSALGSSHPMWHSDGNSIAIKSSSENCQQEFGDFCTSHYSNSNFADFNLYQGLDASSTSTKDDNIEEFGAFGSSNWNNRHPYALSNSGDTHINSVSLEPTERYKVLSQQSLDMNQHAHAWSRCLNSCLLTLASASLAIEKMTEQSVKKEVLESKEGTTYFSAIVEIYKVTARIKVSMEKAAPNNRKLKEISQEIERTWRNIVHFLSGSDFLPPQSSLDFSKHYVLSTEDGSATCGICLLNVNKTAPGTSKQAGGKLMYSGRQYHTTCANFWCNRVDSVLPSLLPVDSLI